MSDPAMAAESAPPARHALQVFDAHHPPSTELISECVHCGFCLANCPTYRLWGEEADSPRGRIYLMKLGVDGEVPLDAAYVGHFDRCLGCMACLSSCPSGVEYDKLIEATRGQIERRFKRPFTERWIRRLIFAVFPHPGRLRVLLFPLWVYQRSGLRWLVRKTGLLSILPKRLRVMEDLLPRVTWRSIVGRRGNVCRDTGVPPVPGAHRSEDPLSKLNPPYSGATGTGETPVSHQRVPVGDEKPLRVGLLLGCVQRVFFDHVNRATARVLEAEGCEVIVPEKQGCCGALMTHAGEEEMALEFARRTIDAFESANVDVIAINAAGCGSAMKEYGHLLRDDPNYARRAEALSAKCRDISEILASIPPRAPRNPLAMRVAYHDACHLQHAQRITAEPRQLLRGIPELELVEIEDAGICCGSAGIYNLLQPTAAQELGARKAQAILKTGASVIVSGNPGCTLQLQSSLNAAGQSPAVLHWIELLAASIDGNIAVESPFIPHHPSRNPR